MRKILISLLILFGSFTVSRAEGGYTIAGKIRGLHVARVYLVSAEPGCSDTLASVPVENDGFVFKGELAGGVRAVNLLFPGVEGRLPILLENIPYQVSVTAKGAMVEGEGPAAELLKEFEQIGLDYAAEQNRIDAELQALGDRANESVVQSLQLRAYNAYKQSVNRTLELIRANAGSYVSAYVIALGMAADDEATLRAKYELLNDAARATIPGKAVAATLDRYGKLAPGEMAPDLTLFRPDGGTFALHTIPAKWKLVHFWASWDNASRQLNPELVRLYLQFRPKGLEIVSISLDGDSSPWRKALGLDGMIWVNGSDLKGRDASEAARLYLVTDLPAFVLLNAENRIVARNLTLPELREKLTELTKKKKRRK